MNAIRIEFGIGVGETGDGKRIDVAAREYLERETIRMVAREYGGCFVVRGQGGWYAPPPDYYESVGSLVMEPGITVTADIRPESPESLPLAVETMAARLAQLWDQTAIHVASWPVAAGNISKEGKEV